MKKGEIHKHWEESQINIVNQKKIKFLKTHNSLISAFGKILQNRNIHWG